MFELYWKIRDHYVTAVRGRERNAFVVQLVSIALTLFFFISLLICYFFNAPIPTFALFSGFLLVAVTTARIADLVEKWYYGPDRLVFRIFQSCFTGFMAIMFFVLAFIG